MFRIFASKSPIFRFSTKSFDVAVIGGGPGGISSIIQVMLLPLRLLNLDLTPFAFKKEEVLVELVSMLDVFPQRHY